MTNKAVCLIFLLSHGDLRLLSDRLSSLCIIQYPVQLSGDPGVHPGVLSHGTAVPPADHSSQGIPAVLLDHHGAAGVSLAGVLAGVSSADHVATG